MIKKDELIKELEECLRVEDRAIPIYFTHIDNTLFFSKYTQADKDRIRKVLDVLRTDSMRHRDIFQSLIDKIKESDRNVY